MGQTTEEATGQTSEATTEAGRAPTALEADGGGQAAPDAAAVAQREPGLGDALAASAGVAELRVGRTVTGTVLAVGPEEALVDVGTRTDGVLPASAAGPDGLGHLAVSERIAVMVTGFDPETGAPRLSRRRVLELEAWRRIEAAQAAGTGLEGVVREQVKGGLAVDVGIRGFMPASQVERGYVADLSLYVGQTLRAKVLEFDRGRGKVILSRRALLEDEARQRHDQVWAELAEGQVREGVVKGLTEFGAFVDLGGVDGLLHVSALSWDRVERPSDVLAMGQTIKVRILRLDRERRKISLGLKQVEPDPWAGIAERYPVGSMVTGRVMRLCSFGAFVQLQPGVDGLIHVSQLSDDPVDDPAAVVHEGQVVHATVIRVSVSAQRISLSLRTTAPVPPEAPARPRPAAASKANMATLGDVVGDLGAMLREGARRPQGDGEAG